MERQEDMKIPTELLPACPRCGKPMTMNLRSDDSGMNYGILKAFGLRFGSEQKTSGAETAPL